MTLPSGTTRYLSSSTPVVATPLTIVSWFRPLQFITNDVIVSIGTTSGSGRFALGRILNLDGINVLQAASVNDSGGGVGAQVAMPSIAGTWYHGAAVFASTNSRTCYLDAVGITNTIFNLGPSAPNELRIGANNVNTRFIGDIAEVAIYNVALTPAEITALAKGFTPDQIRPQSLVFYAPLVRDLIDPKGGLPITNNNSATVVNHPRIIS